MKSGLVIFMSLVIIFLFLMLILFKICLSLESFRIELKYLKSEINRTNGSERRYWIREKRRLWRSLFFHIL